MFKESDLEELIINLIKDKGFTYILGENLERKNEDILLFGDVQQFLKKDMQIKILLMKR